MKCDVAIIGGGPAGCTVGTLLKKHNPKLEVAIFEREQFPRDHVGESLLPLLMRILAEMEVWDKVEAAGFPIKLGAAYRWGRMADQDLYYFNFLPNDERFVEDARPGKYAGQRAETAFQVDRSVYDEILLRHAQEKGCMVFERAKVAKIVHTGDRIDGLVVASEGSSLEALGEEEAVVEAKYYVDASGGESIVRRTLGIGADQPSILRNIAIWDYWQNTDWAEKVGSAGTYVYVLSIGWGWIWFIPVSATRTSIGLVMPAERYKKSGKSPEDLYLEALALQPTVMKLIAKATREGHVQATKDWNFVADRLFGENWYLAGDAGGFADPILSAGLTLAQHGGKRVAFSILERELGELDTLWINEQYNTVQRKNTWNHIRFAEYWYSANEQFTELKEYCSEIAKDSGLSLDPDQAFQWIGTGGFADEVPGLAFSGTFEVTSIKGFISRFGGSEPNWAVRTKNVFKLNLEGADKELQANYMNGRVYQMPAFRRGAHTLPLVGSYKYVVNALQWESDIQALGERFIYEAVKDGRQPSQDVALKCLQTLEALVSEGWVDAAYDPKLPLLDA